MKKSKSLSFKVNKLEKIVKQDRPEHKFFSTSNLGTTIAGTAGNVSSSIVNILDIAQGTNINERIGNEIKVLSVNYKAHVDDQNQDTTLSHRVFLIEDKQQISDTAPSVSDIFSVIHPNNYQLSIANLKRFRILNKSSVRTALAASTNPNEYGELNMFEKFKYPLKVRYNGTASTDGQKNLLYIVNMVEFASSVTNGLYQNVRVKYIDN